MEIKKERRKREIKKADQLITEKLHLKRLTRVSKENESLKKKGISEIFDENTE